MALLRRRPLPPTSYGYRPPPGATAHGWHCASGDCAAQVPRWRRRCRRCGSAADPEFDEPWAHEALGAELSWLASGELRHGAGIARERLIAWRVRDAVVRHDRLAAAEARRAMRDYADLRRAQEPRWNPSLLLGLSVSGALSLGDLDGAAGDLCFWLGLAAGDGAAGDQRALAAGPAVMRAAVSFLAAPGGAAHPRAAEIRKGCLHVAGGCLRAGR